MVHGYACLWSLLHARMQRKRGPGTNNAAPRPRQAEKARHRVHCPAAGMSSGVELSRGGMCTRLEAMTPFGTTFPALWPPTVDEKKMVKKEIETRSVTFTEMNTILYGVRALPRRRDARWMPQVSAGCAGNPGLRRTQDCVAFRPQQSCVVQARAGPGRGAQRAAAPRRRRSSRARGAQAPAPRAQQPSWTAPDKPAPSVPRHSRAQTRGGVTTHLAARVWSGRGGPAAAGVCADDCVRVRRRAEEGCGPVHPGR